MANLRKRMPRFRRPVPRDRYASAPTEGAPSSLWAHLLESRRYGATAADPQSALCLTAYYAGVRVISEDVASLPLNVYKRKKGGGAVLVTDHPVTLAFNRCPAGSSNEMTSMQWREAWIAHVLGWGNGYAAIDWTGDGDFVGAGLMSPKTEPVRDAQQRLFYRDGSNSNNVIPAADILHLAGLGFNGLVGYSPVGLARKAIELGRAAEGYGASLFSNGAMPKGYLKYPAKLSVEGQDNLRKSWNAVHQGIEGANKLAVLTEGLEWVQTSIAPEDAQFLLTRQFQVLEIARILRLPPHKLGDYSQAHLANVEAANLDYLMMTLRPWCIRVEQCLDLKLLSDKEHTLGYYTRHDIRAILRASIKDRAGYYQVMFQFGMSPDEIRELEDMNPIGDAEGGTRRFRSSGLIELNEASVQANPTGVVPPAPKDTEEGDVTDEGVYGIEIRHRNGFPTRNHGEI